MIEQPTEFWTISLSPADLLFENPLTAILPQGKSLLLQILTLRRNPSVANLLPAFSMGTPVALVVAGNLAPATDLCDRRKPSEPDDARVSHNLGVKRRLWLGLVSPSYGKLRI